MGTRKRLALALSGVALSLLASACVSSVEDRAVNETQKQSQGQRLRLADIAGQCESSVDKRAKGFGKVIVDRPVKVYDEEGEIEVPCNIRLSEGGSLSLRNVDVTSKNLIINDFRPNGETRVRIEDSTLTGTARSGFSIQLQDSGDTITIDNSTIKYPMAVWASAGSLKTGGGRIDVTKTTLRSMNPDTEGIRLVVSLENGIGNFSDLDIETVPLDPALDPRVKRVLMLAGECKKERIKGYGGACDPDDPALKNQR